MRTHILLLVGAMAWIGCESATEPSASGTSTQETVQLDAAAGPMSDGLVLREFKLSSEGINVPLGWCDEAAGVLRSAVPGTGRMTHIGRFAVQQSGCIDMTTGVFTDGQGVLTAANGDQMYLEFAGSSTSVAPPTYELHYLVTGGTGRFSSAEGEADLIVIYTSETTWIAEGGGWISYAASDRAER